MFSLQNAQNRRITYDDMATSLDVSSRAFSEWMRGAREPAAMEALLTMLSMLPKDELLRIVDMWKQGAAVTELHAVRSAGKKTKSTLDNSSKERNRVPPKARRKN